MPKKKAIAKSLFMVFITIFKRSRLYLEIKVQVLPNYKIS